MIEKMTDDMINVLADDIYRDRVFTSCHIRQEDMGMLLTIFMPLVFADMKIIEQMRNDAPGMIYEHFSEAGSRSVNGYPTFVSFHIVSKEDTKKVWEKFERIKKAVSEVIKHS